MLSSSLYLNKHMVMAGAQISILRFSGKQHIFFLIVRQKIKDGHCFVFSPMEVLDTLCMSLQIVKDHDHCLTS